MIGRRIPLWFKLLYTAFMALWVPHYWLAYGPTNFLYFCDIALFMVLAAAWLEWPILASMPAIGILLPQTLWCIDFVGVSVGWPLIGTTAYMYNPSIPQFTRLLSLFHAWLPIVVAWLVWRLGYDRRAFIRWTLLSWVILLVCYLWMPPPPAPADNPNLPVNINYVYGFSAKEPQSWCPPLIYLGLAIIVMTVFIYWPTHWVLMRWFPKARSDSPFPALRERG